MGATTDATCTPLPGMTLPPVPISATRSSTSPRFIVPGSITNSNTSFPRSGGSPSSHSTPPTGQDGSHDQDQEEDRYLYPGVGRQG